MSLSLTLYLPRFHSGLMTHVSFRPFPSVAFPPKPGVACPKCDGIHAEMWGMQKSWESLWPSWKWEATDGLPEDKRQGARMQLGLQSICAEQQDVRWSDRMRSWALCNRNNIGCYVATATVRHSIIRREAQQLATKCPSERYYTLSLPMPSTVPT
jgi:hypothetical protein